MFDIQEELKKLPNNSGCYLMKDENDQIIYVGKAINLHNRVRQYFQSDRNKATRTIALVKNIKSFEYIVTSNEVEALILENNLIKTNKPKYNVLLKDDKTYPYIKVTTNEAFPKVFITRLVKKDKARYFGPYTNVYAVRETVDLIHKIWQLKTCQRNLPRDIGKERPCLNFHINKCTAPCAGNITEEKYKETVSQVLSFLSGKHKEIEKMLETQMNDFSINFEFEKAAEVRDTLISLRTLSEKQSITDADGIDQDVIAFARANGEALVQVFFIRGGKMTGREHFLLTGTEDLTRESVMTSFVKQFYGETTFIPKEIIIEDELEQDEKPLINEYISSLKESQVSIIKPQKGEKLKLVEMAHKNAIIQLEQFGEHIKREEKRTTGATEEIRKAINVDNELTRIEAYDISNIQGYESVGSMVVFENGIPKRSDYRKFKVKGVIGPDDYQSMEEVLSRRFARYIKENMENDVNGKFNKLPSLILVDGGKGHVNIAKKVLKELDLQVLVCGLVKDDNHRTRGLFYNNEEINLPYTSEGFKLLTRIQDEVHRFAILYHRKLRSKEQVHSILDDIEKIGETRRKALMTHFKSIDKIRSATIEELEEVPTINKIAAQSVYDFFRK